MRHVAILVAVENYTDRRIPRVKYAADDANDLAAALKEIGFDERDIFILVDDKATKTSIESRIKKVTGGLVSDDQLYVFYSGHGFANAGKNFITCRDTDADDLVTTSIAVEWLFSEFEASESTKIILFLDSCESGMLASSRVKGILTDLTLDELTKFFQAAEHCVCFASCKAGQCSYWSDNYKHGIWSYHLLEALKANACLAIDRGHFITSYSLQDHLAKEVPRTLRSEQTGVVEQTPWFYGALSSTFLVADVGPIFDKRKAKVHPSEDQLRSVIIYSQEAYSVKKLSGFIKGTHHIPQGVYPKAEGFVARIAQKDLERDLELVFERLRNQFNFQRKDLEKRGPAGGSGSIITPLFDYDVSVSQNPDDPSKVIFKYQIGNIREPARILSDQFYEVFGSKFDTVELSDGQHIDVKKIVDKIESLHDPQIKLAYDSDCTYCTLKLPEFDSTVRITEDALFIEQSRACPPKVLIGRFFEVQKSLIEKHQLKALPFPDTTGEDTK
jgi:hypothetical protein